MLLELETRVEPQVLEVGVEEQRSDALSTVLTPYPQGEDVTDVTSP